MHRSLTLLVLLHPQWHWCRIVCRFGVLFGIRVIAPSNERVLKWVSGHGWGQEQWIDYMEVCWAVEDQIQ